MKQLVVTPTNYNIATKRLVHLSTSCIPNTCHVRTEREPRRNYICYRCNGRGHRLDDCRFKDKICHGCGKPGHIKAVCRSGDKNKHYKTSKKVNQMSAAIGDSSNGSDDNEWSDVTVAMVVMTMSGLM